MSNGYIDEALLDAAELSEFPELYAYIHEREPKSIVYGIVNQIIVGPQYLQDQVKDNDNKLNVQPAPSTPITPIPVAAEVITVPLYTLTQPLLPYNIGDGGIKFYQLRNKVVYNIGLYLREDFMGFVFTGFPEELWPFSKHALVLGDDGEHKQNIMDYISEKGLYIGSSIGSVDQITPIKGITHIAIAGVYYTDYEPLKRAVSDVNGDGKINIVDDWYVNCIIDGMKSKSWVQDVVQKQTEATGDGVQPYDPSQPVSLSNYFNNNTKFVSNKIFGPPRVAYFVKEGPICTFNFQAEVGSQHVNNVFKVSEAIDSDLQPRLTKFFPIKTSYISFAGMIQISGNNTPDIVVNQGSWQYPMDLSDFSGSYLIDPQPQESYQNNITSNGEPISHIDSVIIQHDTLPPIPIPPSVFPQYTVTEVSREQLLALAYTPYDLDAFKIYIIDDTVNKLVMFNMHLRQKGFIESKQYLLTLTSPIVSKGLQATSNGLDAIYANNAQDRIFNLTNFRNDVGNFIDEPRLVELTQQQERQKKLLQIKCIFHVLCQQDLDFQFHQMILVFSGFTDYPNSLFGDLKIKFKINPNAFVFAQVNPIIGIAKYYTMNKTDLMASGPDKLKNIDLLFRNWSLGYQYTKQFTQMGCTADLITKISFEQITDSALKSLMCSITPVTLSIKNYVVTDVTVNMSGYKATDDCLQKVREFYANRPFVEPSQRVEAWSFPTSATTTGIRTSQNIPLSRVIDLCLLFPKDARATTCYENSCYHNMQVTTCGRNFPDMQMNTLHQQFFQMQLNASNLDLLFEATDEFEDALTTSRNTASRRFNPHTDLTSFMITLSCERNSNGALTFDGLDIQNQNVSVELRGAPIYQDDTDCYYNADLMGKRLFSPILCTILDTFWLLGHANGGS
ncbi:MAG: hypothetical protein EZS28_019086 [Streblomastix strix]|uniref:Uncharacterized protein n=1 Tax=Streblomastix strix TaxID=222440 RepID=A0A5J4VRY4_9EUKA|nr:MAG: hypothetical protein EZS28_019086 [Streblomastix strix]